MAARAALPDHGSISISRGATMKNRNVLGAVLAASLLAFGAASHAGPAPRGDIDHDGIQNRYDHDRDGDGVRNRHDARPNQHVANVTRVDPFGPNGDIDRDGIKNRYDSDRDGDGIQNRSDPNPNVFNPTRIVRGHDMDRDGIADRSDRDRDGDRIPNGRDRFPNDARRS
jgi:hypothetical protein